MRNEFVTPDSKSVVIRGLSYCRVSTEEQADNNSLPQQERVNREKLLACGCTEIEVLHDTDSGSKWEDRQGLGAYLEKIKSGYYKFVCIDSVNRAVRSWELIAYLSRHCKEGQAKLIFASRDYGEHRGGELMMVIDAFGSQWWKEDLIAAMLKGRVGRIHSGKAPMAGPEKIGWERDKATGEVILIEAEAEIIRRAANLLDAGYGFRTVAKMLNAEGFRTKRNAMWSPNALHRIFTAPAYKGEAYAFRYRIDRAAGRRKILKPQSEWLKVKATYPAIITPEQWNRINTQHKQNSGVAARNRRWLVLLRGMVMCGLCGGAMWHTTSRRKVAGEYGTYGYYRCADVVKKATTTNGHQPACAGIGVAQQWLEQAIWNAVCEEIDILANGRRIQQREQTARVSSDEALAQRLKKQIEQKNSEADKLAASLRRAPEIVAFRIEKQLEAIESERLAIEARLHELERVFQLSAQQNQRERDVLKMCLEKQSHLPKMSLSKRREILELVGAKIFVERNRVRLFSALTNEPIEILY